MRIIAIDPGEKQSAWLCWDTETHDLGDKGIDENERLECEILPIIVDHSECVCIEFPQSYGMNVGKSIMNTCRWVGRFEAVCRDTPVRLYGRPTIKAQIGGRTDAEIRASLRMRYGEAKKGEKLEGIKKDLWAALALAVAVSENPNLKKVE